MPVTEWGRRRPPPKGEGKSSVGDGYQREKRGPLPRVYREDDSAKQAPRNIS